MPIAQQLENLGELAFSRLNLKNFLSYSVRVLDSNTLPSKNIRNLGLFMDRDLTMSL